MNTYHIEGRSITEWLLALAERGNKPFTERLHPNILGVLGLRLPDLRKLAKMIAKDPNWREYLAEAERGASSLKEDFMEARTLHGLVLGAIPHRDLEEYLGYVARWVPRINSWSVCDCFSFSGGKSLVAKHSDRLWSFLLPYFGAKGEYEVRFGVVATMQYFIDEEHLLPLLDHYAGVHHEGYYVQMALAWAIAECYIRFPDQTLPYLSQPHFHPWVHNKAIQKICESYRISPSTKAMLRALKI